MESTIVRLHRQWPQLVAFFCNCVVAALGIACVERRIAGDGRYVAGGQEFDVWLDLELTDATSLQSVLNVKWPAAATPGMTEAEAREALGSPQEVVERNGSRWARWRVDGASLDIGNVDVGSQTEARRWLLRLDPDKKRLTDILSPALHRYVERGGHTEVTLIARNENRRLFIVLRNGAVDYMELLTVPPGLPRLGPSP